MRQFGILASISALPAPGLLSAFGRARRACGVVELAGGAFLKARRRHPIGLATRRPPPTPGHPGHPWKCARKLLAAGFQRLSDQGARKKNRDLLLLNQGRGEAATDQKFPALDTRHLEGSSIATDPGAAAPAAIPQTKRAAT